MKQSGSADLALMGGHIPRWLSERMTRMSLAIVEAILAEYGHQTFLSRMANPFWFQSFGAVIGMDWNSSGVTTAVMRALQQAINPQAAALGLFVCGGKGSQSRQTPDELIRIGDHTGLDGTELARTSKLVAKVDSAAVQDGFQLYMHNFLLTDKGDWTVIQQGMKPKSHSARRYHWHSRDVHSFVEDPHTAVCGLNEGEILNLVAGEADPTRRGILTLTREAPGSVMKELPRLLVPLQKGISAKDVDIKRLGSILQLAHEQETQQFEDLLLLKGLGARTLQSLTLVSEVIHGTPSRFSDPARFAFAHGSKGGNPFPVPTRVYDETITTLRKAVDMAKIGQSDKQKAIRKLTDLSQKIEDGFSPTEQVDDLLEKEKRESWKYGGRTINGFEQAPESPKGKQLGLFDE